jgi:hypothetical protein
VFDRVAALILVACLFAVTAGATYLAYKLFRSSR